jgi:hypothetical protein
MKEITDLMSYNFLRQSTLAPPYWITAMGLTRVLGAGLGCDPRMSRTAAILGDEALASLTIIYDDLCEVVSNQRPCSKFCNISIPKRGQTGN